MASVVLERVNDAERRGARSRAIVAGWGESADAHHLTRPHPEGDGALAAMRQALDRARIAPADLDLIAAHATGTPDNDSSEAAAIGRLLGGDVSRAAVVGFKSHLGHTLGGAGAVELILSTLAIRDGMIPPTANVAAADVEYPTLPLATGVERTAKIRHTLNTSLGFGGANTCVVLRKPEAATLPWTLRPTRIADEACVTGIGVVLPGTVGNDAFIAALRAGRLPTDVRTIDDAAIESCVVNARRMRRMSGYVKLSLAAVSIACRDAGIAGDAALLADSSAILGTAHGSAAYCYDYYAQVVREGVLAANPMLFAEGVPNAAAAQVSMMLGLRGACQTILGTWTAGLDALRLASLRVANGEADRVIVCAAEESHWTLDAAYGACGFKNPSLSLAVAFIVESGRVANARGSRVYATIGASHSSCGHENGMAAIRAAYAGASRATILRRHVFGHGNDDFSVHALLQVAAELLDPMPGAAFAFATHAIDRSGIATSLTFGHVPASSAGAAVTSA